MTSSDDIPFVDLHAQYESLQDDISRAMQEVISSSAFIRGPQLGQFEKDFAKAQGVSRAIGVASGTDALDLAVRALGIGPGDEVITVSNTWISTVFAISKVGATPVIVDIDPDSHQIDVEAVRAAISERTRAIIPVHLFGHPAPVDQIVDICRPLGIFVIEDVAQAPLATLNGKLAGTIGDVGCFSFYPSKNLGCYGDGGAIITDDEALAERMAVLANYGQQTPFDHQEIGINSRLDTLQAAVLSIKLPYLSGWNESRRQKAAVYDRLIGNLPVKIVRPPDNGVSAYHLYVIEVDRRDDCRAFLDARGIKTQIHYPAPVHLQACYTDLGYRAGSLPVVERAMSRVLSLPIYPEITDDQQQRVADALADFLNDQ